ncbi:ribosomal protein S18 acetylase RimI-like enzyme [Scopulibacillus darangshiensis]|uniref:Ribosomal protein S18 acetylase RimI-like enzyme n=1 Tax=Scopulibacillus darangshiensis TaxID=442528 RepID=A0A4R2P5J3_9BACL|nr:GNAT family N-acetyltransferase [Scopulibacillus darangshiensis]TCP29384.1 ribosomal protein S18 acetylase RimI-like enzyme [Scopulibacillus darangshiensis]
MKIRTVKASDYNDIIPVINDWWSGRQMADMLPKLFFVHFSNTSFIAEQDGKIIGFLIGFLSQTYQQEAYIHFAGVHPEYRKQDIGKRLYNTFFNVVQEHGRHIVRCVTSPVNKTSIAYHTEMGFEIENGDKSVDGLPIGSNYDGPNQERVLFIKRL